MASAVALAALLAAAAACSPKNPESQTSAGGKAVPTFRSLDTNVDGSITPDEAEKFADLAVVFPQADRDRDGRLSNDEYDEAVDELIKS
jgi:hypothetical protein